MNPERREPWGLKWRSSVWLVTAVVSLGITTDLLIYSIIIPVLPFQLENLGYTGVSGLIGWLLFGYSGGLVLATPPIAAISERYSDRKWFLIFGQVFLVGSQIMLMEAPTYWVMVFARVIQGISSSVVWVIGLALICDTSPEAVVGRQLGLAMTGLSLGLLIGPPVGGALYKTFGFRGPFVFGVIITMVDLIGRLLIIERKDALLYGVDPAAMLEKPQIDAQEKDVEKAPEPQAATLTPQTEQAEPVNGSDVINPVDVPHPKLPLMKVVSTLLRSPRAITVMLNTLIYGLAYSSIEPALPLHLQDVWGLNSSKVGIVFVAAVVPTLFSAPISGWWADHKGTELVTVICLLLSIPWWILMIIQKTLAFFIVVFALQSFFTSGVISPLTVELAAVSRSYDGVGYGHVYGAFNLSYGIGAALGPIIGGQIFAHVGNGWTVICLLTVGLLAFSSCLASCYTGDKPLLFRLIARWKRPQSHNIDTQA